MIYYILFDWPLNSLRVRAALSSPETPVSHPLVACSRCPKNVCEDLTCFVNGKVQHEYQLEKRQTYAPQRLMFSLLPTSDITGTDQRLGKALG